MKLESEESELESVPFIAAGAEEVVAERKAGLHRLSSLSTQVK